MYNFYAFLGRMKYIDRWSLMHSIKKENIMEHSQEVAIITHALCLIKNKMFNGKLNVEKALLLALYHEVGEVITGDLPTPIKYFNSEIQSAYKDLEVKACEKLLNMLPDELKEEYRESILPDKNIEEAKIVKYADKISAYIKCLEELKQGNSEFKKAESTIKKAIKEYDSEEVNYFMDNFVGAYKLTLDELD